MRRLAGVQRRLRGCCVAGFAAGLLANACGQSPVAEPEGTGRSAAVERADAASRASEDRSRGGVSQRSHPAALADRTQRAQVEVLQRTLVPRPQRSAPGLTAQRTTAGSMRIDLQGSYRHVSVLSRRPDGSFERSCTMSTQRAPTTVVQRAREAGQ
jgi:hypothetical protein